MSSTAVFACDLLVFDLDGTLIDSRQDLANSVNATLASLHLPLLPHDRIAGFIGDGASVLLQRSLEASLPPGESIQDRMASAFPFFLDYYRSHKLDHTYVYAGVHTALRTLRESATDVLMAVLTNKPYRPSRQICDALGLAPYFFQNYGGDSFATKKPDPTGMHVLIEEASDRLGRAIPLSRVVLIGDSHVDVRTARAAGVRVLGCSYGLDPDGLLAAHPDAIAATPAEWLTALRSLL